MRVSLLKNNSLLELGETLVHVEVSEIDDPPIYSHSFKYKVPSGIDKKGKIYGEIIIYTDKNAASGSSSFSFDLEECRNKDCKGGCRVIQGKPNRLLVADVFHTKPTENALQTFGTALFKALFSGYAGQLLQKTEPPHPNGGIYLQYNRYAELDAIPWEYANDRTTFLVHQRKFARVYEHPQVLLPKLPLRIVAVVPDVPGANLSDLHLGEQFRTFINGFTKNQKAIMLERVFPPTVRQMDAQLMNERETATVLHFMGHCGQKGTDGPRALIFEHSDNGQQEYINASRLISMPDNLRLAFLSACDSRDVARVLAERGLPYTIGSNCPIPDDLARQFEFDFYKFLTGGSTVERAMCQARASLQDPDDIRRRSYFAGAMLFYSSKFGEDDSTFKCEVGDPNIKLNEPPHNFMELPTVANFRGRKKELSKLYTDLKRMVDRGEGFSHIYTITGTGSREFVVEAMRRMAHLFPGGIFAWAFDKETTSVLDYFWRLVKIIFSKEVGSRLTERHSSDVELGSAIIRQLQTGNHATCLLILDHADILDRGRKERNMHAKKLGSWLENVTSVRDTVKILLTSKEPLDWLKGELMDLNGQSDLKIDSEERGYISISSGNIHKYFAPVKEPIYFYGVPNENLAFVERSDILANMETALDVCRILVLKGLGGIGKTQLMLRYCYLHRTEYDYVFWLEVESWSAAVESFRKLVIKLGMAEESIKGEDSGKKIIDWFHSWLHDKTKWLLLLDNADNDEMDKKVFELLPRIGGNIILTTRMYVSRTKAKVLHVDKMQEKEAILLLYGGNPVDQKITKYNYARKIVTELDCMPLAINLARAYIERIRTSFKDYLSKFNEQKKRVNLLEYSDKNSDQYEYTVSTVWQISFERIRALDPTTVLILEACAFLHPESIPVGLFKQQCSVLIPSFSTVTSNEQDNGDISDVIGEAVTTLVEFSFVTRITKELEDEDGDEEYPTSDLLTIHRLVQKVIYDKMDSEQRMRWAHNLATALNKDAQYADSAIYTSHTQRIMNTYTSHIHHLVKLIGELSQKPFVSKDLSSLLNRAIRYLLKHGRYFDISELVQFSRLVSEATYGEEDEHNVRSLGNYAEFHRLLGKYDDAELLYQRALAINEKARGSEHSCTAMSLINLANVYSDQGKYDEAEPLYKQALAIREKALGSEHPDTAQLMNSLASHYDNQGKYDGPKPLFQSDLIIDEKANGSEHSHIATSLNNLAMLYKKRGKYDEAEPLYKQALEIREKTLGSEHPNTAKSLNNLAILYDNRGKYNEAEPLYKRALVIREKMLGLEHPDTAASLNNLANLYRKQSKYDEAEPLYMRVLAIRERALGSEHLDTAGLLNNLAILYKIQGKYDEAELLYKRALMIREKALGSEHPDTAQSLNNLAILYDDRGKYDEAEPLYKRALVIRQMVLGLEHPETMKTRKFLARFYRRREQK